MAEIELILPKMGESVAEATVTNWLKEEGAVVELDESVLEIATDKVDSEVPSTVEGVLIKRLYEEGDVVQVGAPFAIIQTDGDAPAAPTSSPAAVSTTATEAAPVTLADKSNITAIESGDRFYSPLVKSMAKEEGIAQNELDGINGTGKDGRLTKDDLLAYIKTRGNGSASAPIGDSPSPKAAPSKKPAPEKNAAPMS
ncbi:E3 binding domain-containing protein, partial [Flavobacteriales bacterium]|nr:E3 binding domain-containing protein [Flavobacteriales bacterium]